MDIQNNSIVTDADTDVLDSQITQMILLKLIILIMNSKKN